MDCMTDTGVPGVDNSIRCVFGLAAYSYYDCTRSGSSKISAYSRT